MYIEISLQIKFTIRFDLCICLILMCFPYILHAQNNDSVPQLKKTQSLLQKLHSSISRHNVTVRDTASTINLTIENNRKRFSPYQGKVIRNISVHQLNFYQSMDDTAVGKKYFGTQLLTRFHRMTRPAVIRNNLFIHEGETFYATVAADNERFLRTIAFIQDARLIMDSIPGTDSMDIVVLTKDLFSISGSLSSITSSNFKASVEEVNLGGLGQSVYYTAYYEKTRRPSYDGSLGYRYNNMFGSFADLTAYVSNIGNNLITGDKNEAFQYVEVSVPMISQYRKYMGGIALSHAQTRDVFPKLDSSDRYFKYRYSTFDVWGGLNLGITKYIMNEKNYLRKFLAFRYAKYTFHNAPDQIITPFDMRTNSREMALAQFTLFKQEFYQTRYFYGFGTVEDIPYGFNYNITAGWYRQRRSSRPYLGVDLNHYMLTKSGDIFQFFVKGGSFFKNGLQDAGYAIGSTFFSRVMPVGGTKIRQVLRASYSEIFNTVTSYPLRLNNSQYGLSSFRSDSVWGSRRLSLHSETRFFTPCKVFGFILAPYLSSDLSFLTPMKATLERSALYIGLGPGLRIRNENLVFGTMEFSSMYFPRNIHGQNSFQVGMRANLSFRFNSNYVNKPAIYDLNNDPNGTIY